MRSNCIRCSTPLIQNPDKPHWRHCPVCDPTWADYSAEEAQRRGMEALTRRWAADKRGVPHVGAVQKK